MRMLRLTSLMLLGAALFLVPACVELTGQRISWFHDEANDELRILIFYDGIHDSGSDKHGKGSEQISQFVKNGDVMIMDWWCHFDMEELRKAADDPDAEAVEREEGRLITTSIRSEPIGYYREPDGRIGAAQLVSIPNLNDFLRRLNTTISVGITAAEADDKDAEMPRTSQRMRAVAEDGHQWVTLDGHAILFKIPVHPDEWARYKGKFLRDLFDAVVEALGDDGVYADRIIMQGLSSVPVSYVDQGDWVTFVLGQRDAPGTLRLAVRDEYEASLEQVVIGEAKVDLDKSLAEKVLGTGSTLSSPLSDILRWGPPEEQIRALIAVAGSDEGEQKEAAIVRLESWAEGWRVDHGIPKAPPKMEDLTSYLLAWAQFYHALKEYPIHEEVE